MFRAVFDKVHESFYALDTQSVSGRGIGTAFAVSQDGALATAMHVVRGIDISRSYLTKTMGQRRYFSFEIVASDSMVDLAILKLKDPDPQFAPINISSTPAFYGESVLAIGYPLTYRSIVEQAECKPMLNVRVCGCTVASDMSFPPLDGSSGEKVEVFEVDTNLHPGMSGGPVLNRAAELVGIISRAVMRPQNVEEPHLTVCVRSEHLARLLKRAP